MRRTPLPTILALRTVFKYDPRSGALTGRKFATGPNGYSRVKIGGSRVLVHRAIWALMTGAWPEGEIDHADGDITNNRWYNLRQATRSQQRQNIKRYRHGGVHWVANRNKWRVMIKIDGVNHYRGMFSDKEEAPTVWRTLKAELHPFYE